MEAKVKKKIKDMNINASDEVDGCHVANPFWYDYVCLVRGTPYNI